MNENLIPEKDENFLTENEYSTSYLQAVIDTAQTGIFLFAPIKDEGGNVIDFRFRIANRMLAAYVGQQPEAIIGGLGSKWFPAYKTNGLFHHYAGTYNTGITARFDFHYNADGIDVWLDIMATKVNDDVLVTFSDYTPIKQLQQQMEASMDELKRSNNNLEEFAYIASHDLQEPLRKIKAFGGMLVKRYEEKLDADGVDLLQRIASAADRMTLLIDDLLVFSRISYQKNELQSVDLNTIVNGVITDLETAVKDKRASIHVDNLLPVVGDSSLLRQLFQNLLGNALKFTEQAAQPIINVSCEAITGKASGFQLANGDLQRRYQLIRINDNGIGFEQQYADRIFQIFQRLHGKKEYPGTGVGLSIVHKVVGIHEGHIKAEGAPGQGATFSMLLPLENEP